MLSRWVRYRRVVWLVLLLATVFGLGLWAGGRNGRPAAVIGVVNVAHSKSGEHAYGNIEIRDRQTIDLLDTLFPNYRREALSGTPPAPAGEHYTLEFMLEWLASSKELAAVC